MAQIAVIRNENEKLSVLGRLALITSIKKSLRTIMLLISDTLGLVLVCFLEPRITWCSRMK